MDVPTDDFVEIVITAPDAEWLAAFVRQLVDDHLAAGAHLVAPVRSIYRWQGQVHDVAEARVAIHTLAVHLPAIVERTNAQHPYEVPCVVALPIVGGNPRYVAWIRRSSVDSPEHEVQE